MIDHYLQKVRRAKPLIHCITNYVTVNDCANILLACGASPIMADDQGEVEDITSLCSALTLNIGTLNSRTIESMFVAGRRANELRRPILLDPVGAGASTLRTQTALRLMSELKLAVIRGNVSEIRTLAGLKGTTQGVDVCPGDEVTADNLSQAKAMAEELSRKTGAIIAISGPIDIVTDGTTTFEIRRGCPEMTRYTGCGCMLSALTTAFIAVENSVESCVAAFTLMGMAGERAKAKMIQTESGNASMGKMIIDEVFIRSEMRETRCGLVRSEELGVRGDAKRSSEVNGSKEFTDSCGSTSTPHSSLLTPHLKSGSTNLASRFSLLASNDKLTTSLQMYAVTDRAWLKGDALATAVESALRGGATFVQLREKHLDKDEFLKSALEIKELCRQYKVPFVINDDIEIAQLCDADGVHVGQDDMPITDVRKILGEDKIIGVSAHTVEEALQAQQGGADYLGVGAMFATSTKQDAELVLIETLRDICKTVSIPVVAIGGITRDNLVQLSNCGLSGVAVVSALFAQPDIESATRDLLAQVEMTIA